MPLSPQNLPFRTDNKVRLLGHILWFCGLAFSLPFVMVKFQLDKKAT